MTEFIKPFRMSAKSWADICEVSRYRAATPTLLSLLSESLAVEGMVERLNRAISQKWLTSLRLPGEESIYALGPKGMRYFGVHYKPGFPFASDGLLQHLGIATFCAASGFKRLLREEFRAAFPQCHRPGLPGQNYCLDKSDFMRISWPIVDHGSASYRFPGKAAKAVAARLVLPGYQELFRAEKFHIVVVTATAEKAHDIQTAFQNSPPLTVPVTVVYVPTLLPFQFKL